MNQIADPMAPLGVLLDAAASEVLEIDDRTLTEALRAPLPGWWVSPSDPGFDELQDRVAERVLRRDWRVCLELLVQRGDPAVLARVSALRDGVDDADVAPAPSAADQRLLWHLGSARPLALIAAALELTPAELAELVAALRAGLGAWATQVTEERVGDRFELAAWRAARQGEEEAVEPARELLASSGGAFHLRPTQPTSLEDERCLVVEELPHPAGVVTRLSYPYPSELPPPTVRWRFTFEPRDEELHLHGLGLDRITLGLARIASGTEATFALLLDQIFPHRRGEFRPDGSYRIEWLGRLPRIDRCSLRVEPSAK